MSTRAGSDEESFGLVREGRGVQSQISTIIIIIIIIITLSLVGNSMEIVRSRWKCSASSPSAIDFSFFPHLFEIPISLTFIYLMKQKEIWTIGW